MPRSTRASQLFIDTWGWLALADARDPAHKDVVRERRLRSSRGELVTTDYVLDETITRLYSRSPYSSARRFSDAVFEASALGFLQIERIGVDRFAAAYELRLRYRDKPGFSFTDLTSFVVMRELGIREVLTADVHFDQVHLGFQRVPR